MTLDLAENLDVAAASETLAPHPAEALRWHVLHTKSRQEKALAESLDALSLSYFLPLSRQVRFYGKRKFQIEIPLFPGYLFLRSTLEQAYTVDRTKRVAKIITVKDQAKLDEELTNIRLVLQKGQELDPFPYLQRNVPVQVTSGPLKGVRGVIEDRTRRNRLILQVDVLGQATSLEIDGSLLEPIE